ncbi:porin family protein [Rufibacter sediminis]|uniref:PorT family protein n=1 Tax=Rufibacter sediminis TaxID=2762756 RepID=A0ABR6VTH0_9BACT|nr:porin family protein [Rufibacter sediminis]MBC3540462.1 PorT family protein [Rufibacter sediminis]
MKMIRFTPLVLAFAALFCFSQEASAQVEIGVKVSPSVTSTRTIAKDQYNFKNDGAGVGFGLGVIADYFFGTNYAFSSGLLYNVKGGEVAYNYTQNVDGVTTNKSGSDDINLQYLEIPLTLKLFTNEVAPETRLYFQAGGSLNTMLAAKVNDKKVEDSSGDKYTKRFNTFEIGAVLGAGAEWQLGQSTKVFGGLSYHRGLTDVDDNYYSGTFGDKKVELKNNSFALDFGIKF